MPRISEFYGVVIFMYFSEHGVPHFHAVYGGAQASISISEARLMEGRLTRRAERLVTEWARLHRAELLADWERARHHQRLVPIDPLD